MRSYHVAAWNVQSGGFDGYPSDAHKPPRLASIQNGVAALGASVVGLVDTFRWKELYTADDLCEMFGYPKAFHADMGCDCGVVDPRIGLAVLGNETMIECEPVWIFDRYCLRATLLVDGECVYLYIVYLTSFSGIRRREEVKALLRHIREHSPGRVAVMGDLNSIRPERLLWPFRLWHGARRRPLVVPRHVGRFTELVELADTEAIALLREEGFQDELQADRGPTFHKRVKGLRLGVAVDYVLTRDFDAGKCKVRRGPWFEFASDHCPAVATFG